MERGYNFKNMKTSADVLDMNWEIKNEKAMILHDHLHAIYIYKSYAILWHACCGSQQESEKTGFLRIFQ